MTLYVYDSFGEALGEVEHIDDIPEWENALQRTARQIAKANNGYIEDGNEQVVYDSEEDYE